MKVYVLITDHCYDYEQNVDAEVFQTLGQAQEAMFGYVQSWQHENRDLEKCWTVDDESNMSWQAYEDGDYTRNHAAWLIREREVQPDKELQNADEKGAGGLWDKAAEITTAVALEMQANDLTNPNVPALYAEDCGQERVYELIKQLLQ